MFFFQSQGIILSNARLVELDLSDNAFGPIGMDGIVDLLRSPSCFTLQELRLNNTGCGVTGGKVLAETLMECYNSSGKTLALKVGCDCERPFEKASLSKFHFYR